MEIQLYHWATTTGMPAGQATFRSQLSDFFVSESLRFEPSGEGAHHLLLIEKNNINTDVVCHKLRRFAEVKPTDIGYAGKKDRFAVARQWFSVQLPLLRDIDWQQLNDEEIKVLQTSRHDKKLRIGAVKENHFKIILREFQGDRALLLEKIEQIKSQGFANYFGSQRFGRQGSNLERGLDLLATNKRIKNRNLQGLLFSVVRSFLFNHLLSERIKKGWFTSLLEGDYVQLDGSESGFLVENLSQEMIRFEENDIHPTALLAGRGREQVAHVSLQFEQDTLVEYQHIVEQLERRGLHADRRAIRVFPKNVMIDWHNDETLALSFSLPKGAFATSFLRELVTLKQIESYDD